MSCLLTKFTYTKSEDVVNNNYQDITDCESVSINLGSEGKNNNLRITLKNPISGTYSNGTSKFTWLDSNGTIKL